MNMTPRGLAEAIFREALKRTGVRTRMAAQVRCDGVHFYVAGREFRLGSFRRIGLVALGKAAVSMSDALMDHLGRTVDGTGKVTGIVVSSTPPSRPDAALLYRQGGHPVPTQASWEAADAVLQYLSEFSAEDLVIFMISGGASALVERPIHPGVTLEQTAELYRALLHGGLSIGEMNCVRKHLSAVKGGRLAAAANGATQLSLLVSDVPGDDRSVIGSGPSAPDSSTVTECDCILTQLFNSGYLSPALTDMMRSVAMRETPKPGDAIFERSSWTCVLSPQDLLEEARRLAQAAGYHVVLDNTCDDWDYAAAATYLLERMRGLCAQHERVCLLSGGELCVRLPARVGLGGRNQQFALACALRLAETMEPVSVLSAGTDGVDGNSPAAGAVIDENTCALARTLGLDPRSYAVRFDSFTLLDRLAATIVTGPTENNLRDLRILLSTAPDRARNTEVSVRLDRNVYGFGS